MGYEARADLAIYIAGLSPAMLRLAGEIGDGVMLWMCNPDYIRDVVVPEVTTGRQRAGKPLDGFDLVPYFSLPFYRTMLERSGYGDDIAGFDRGMAEGGRKAATAAISERFLENLAAIGPTEAAEGSVRRYQEAGATSPCIGGVPGTDFDATLAALAHLTG